MKFTNAKGHFFVSSNDDPSFCVYCCYPAADHRSRPKYWVLSRQEWLMLRDCYGEPTLWKHCEIGNMSNAFLLANDRFGREAIKGLPERKLFDWSEVGEWPKVK